MTSEKINDVKKTTEQSQHKPTTTHQSRKPGSHFGNKPGQPRDASGKPTRERGPRGKSDFRKPKEQSEFSERVIWIRRINKVTTGGRRLRFAATVAVGNGKGTVGLFIAKAYEVSDAIKKASAGAHKNLKKIVINQMASIPHDGIGKHCASKILLKPAKEGIGIKAGGAARDIIELAGIKNIYSKSLGSNNKNNLARATIAGLCSLKPEEYFKMRATRKNHTEVVTESKK